MSAVKYSIVVPAYKEKGNLTPLTERVCAALEKDGFAKGSFEMVIVDDNSRDGSVEAVQDLKKRGYPVDILVRTTERGLSSAVIHGIRKSVGEYVMVMDADLQHPPESVPQLFRAFDRRSPKSASPSSAASRRSASVDFVLGTRYGAGVAIDKDWPVHRRIISWGARILARPLTPLSDPMSGFFAIRRDVFSRGEKDVSPIGYKIALELFVKCRVQQFEEVGFSFAARTVGESKLTGKVIVHYIKHLRALYVFSFGILLWLLIPVLILLFYAAVSLIA
jgi:dolichol-phosphate mannosyltransferase